MIPFEASAVGTGALLLLSGSSGSARGSSGPCSASPPGCCWGSPTSSVKALTGTVPGDPLSILGPWTLVALIAGVGAFFALARGMQTTASDPGDHPHHGGRQLVSVAGGILVFGDPVGADPLDVVARCRAFAAVIGAVALMPAPRTAATQA